MSSYSSSNVLISPSILGIDNGNLKSELQKLEEAGADMLHVDVMDGNFVSEITFGASYVKTLKGLTSVYLDTHLMVNNPSRHIDNFVKSGSDGLTIHYEASSHIHRDLGYIKSLGRRAGVSYNPATPVESLKYMKDVVDLVLIMSVNPGFGGQKFIQSSIDKIKEVRDICGDSVIVQVDGGVSDANSKALIEAGASSLVSGSYILSSSDYKASIDSLR